MSKHNLSDFTNEEPQVEATAEPEVETKEEAEAKAGEEGETLELTELADEGEEEAETGENGTGEAEPKPKKPVQERFDKLVGRAKDAERREQDRAREVEYWKGVAEGRIKHEPEPKHEGDGRPKPEDFEFGDADPAYWEAVTDWKAGSIVDQKLGQLSQQNEAKQAIQQLESNYSQRLNEVKEELPDYDEVVTKAAKRGEWPCPPLISLGIKASEVGPKIAHHLATNLEEAIELSELSPADQLVALGRLEAKFLYAPKAEVKVTQAPPPPKTLSRGSGGQFETTDRSMYRKMLKEFR